MRKGSLIDGAVGKRQSTLAVLAAVLPLATVRGAILPLDDGRTVHLAAFPEAIVLPALLLANEQAVTLLISLAVLAFIVVTVGPSTHAHAPGQATAELTLIGLEA